MKKFLALILTALMLVCCIVPAFAADYNIDTAKASVVRIVVHATIDDPNAGSERGVEHTYIGSGFAIGDINKETITHIVTSGHMVMHNLDAPDVDDTYIELRRDGNRYFYHVKVNDIEVLFGDSNSYIWGSVEGWSPRADVAVIRLNQETNLRKPAVLLDKRDFNTGTALTAMGFPSASEDNLTSTVVDEMISTTEKVTANTGFFSNWDNNATTHAGDQITTTAEMSDGISGGPLVTEDGYVVGMCTSRSVNSQNVNYAVATDEILALINSLNGVSVTTGPLQKGLSTTTIIIIAAAAVVVIALLAIMLVSNGKKSVRTLVMGGAMAGKSINLKKGQPVIIGRDPNKCQIVYPKDTSGVSGVHCTITWDGNEVTVADNGSSYGTFVGGTKVEPGRPMVMHRGQEVTFGSDKNKAELH